MSEQPPLVSYDQDGDYLEVLWAVREGVFSSTDDERVLKRLDEDGEVIGFIIHDLSTLQKSGTVELRLTAEPATSTAQ